MLLLLEFFNVSGLSSNRYADQLYEDLLYFYNKNVRPVRNASSAVQVKFGASLIRIIDVDEVNQVLTTNLWLEMQWYDYKLTWDPEKWNNIRKLHVPSDQIWIPDILLYNNADGEPHITIMSDALVYYTGAVVWKPPSIYKSFCPIDIEYFPYDKQSCSMKFGGWSYNGFQIDVRQLTIFFMCYSIWDLISLTSRRHERLYPGCCGQEFYIDITFNLSIRRKTLFYTVNLVIPCMLIAILTTFVFYIPGIEHKVSFSIAVLVTLTVFYLVLIDLIPPTSMVIPMIGKYLLFTMFLVSASILLSVLTVSYYRRAGTTHPMPKWMRHIFLKTLPKYLFIKPPEDDASEESSNRSSDLLSSSTSRRTSPYFLSISNLIDGQMRLSQLAQLRGMHPDLIRRMIDNVSFIADHFRAMKKDDQVSEDWCYISMVLDRLMLMIFSVINVCGTLIILLQSPVLYDSRPPMTINPAIKPLSGDTLELFVNSSYVQ
uniref:BMA-ACR-8 n=1 Tax=Brugia malayi TaxID=6279 RepID=A0A0J9XWY8_BRUMA|nr:BMA-ACR-8 [Brugia malayi]